MATKRGNRSGDQNGQTDKSKVDDDEDEDEDLLGTGDDDDSDEDDDADGGDDDEDEDDEDEAPKSKKQQAQFVTKADLDAAMQRVGDRLVNTVLKEVRGGSLRKDPPKAGTGQQQKSGRSASQDEAPVADVRGARVAFRDYLSSSGLKFISPEEQQFAQGLGQTLIKARAFEGFDDEDKVGQDVAKEVAEQVAALRKHYETKTKAVLKRRGLLLEQKSGQSGSGTSGGQGVATDSAFAAGAEVAKARHPQQK